MSRVVPSNPATELPSYPAQPPVTQHRATWHLSFDWEGFVIGACVAFTVYIAVIPLGFLLGRVSARPRRRRSTPSSRWATSRGLRNSDTFAAVLDLDSIRGRHRRLRLSLGTTLAG